ncbi:CFEM domain-containing protein [Phlyctema vagabunda]|uniref:CFEM domain-containing protein n=1 Tax=Phlyctema vagabunda TaxID=108571 RepID=A0ABR4P7N0_9HELO
MVSFHLLLLQHCKTTDHPALPSFVYGNPYLTGKETRLTCSSIANMKYSFAALTVVAFSGLASAQIPSCATSCIADAVASATTCGADDVACQCAAPNQSAIQAASTTCVISACGATEALNVLSAAQAACAAVSATAGESATSSSAAAPSETTSEAAATTTEETVSTTTSVASTEVVETTSVASSSAAATTAATTSSVVVVSSSEVASPTSNSASATASTSAPVETFTGAASHVGASFGGAVVVGLAALAAL